MLFHGLFVRSFIRASSYDGVEMLSVCEHESEDVPNRAFDGKLLD